MQEFIRLILRNSTFLTFLLLEVFGIFLVVQFNTRKQRLFSTSSSIVVGGIINQYNKGISFFKLRKENEQLLEENAELRAQLFKLEDWVGDKKAEEVFFDENGAVIPCKVLSNSIVQEDNYIVLDKGLQEGVQPQMGIFSSVGIVGIIIEASDSYSTAMSLLHRQTRISAGISGTGFFGTMVRKEADPYHMIIEDIPSHAEVEVGDTIVTSGYSSIFPPQIPVGVVIQVNEPVEGDYFKTLEIKLINDLSELTYVYAWSLQNDRIDNE